jgi:hypothetical protein
MRTDARLGPCAMPSLLARGVATRARDAGNEIVIRPVEEMMPSACIRVQFLPALLGG